jgi:hypothetical protein
MTTPDATRAAPDASDRDKAFSVAVELERLGRHYSDGEDISVIEIRIGRLITVLESTLASVRTTSYRDGYDAAIKTLRERGWPSAADCLERNRDHQEGN